MSKAPLRINLVVIAWLIASPWCVAENRAAASPAAGPSITEAISTFPDAPSAARTADPADNAVEQARPRGAEPATTGGLSRTIDAQYVVEMSSMFASSIVNVEKTNKCIEQHTCSFVPVPFRSRAALYGAGIPVELGIAYVSYKLKQHGHRWWFVPALVVTGANAYLAYHSANEPSYSGKSQ